MRFPTSGPTIKRHSTVRRALRRRSTAAFPCLLRRHQLRERVLRHLRILRNLEIQPVRSKNRYRRRT
ncbi:hypothetical protein HanXRQr2_Chr07g0310021 [Helianthus annuus]|uniref:Uncharacterized protein n=1 Tax=Helianthus annuus TaxID=4232 RepID=A0A9K3IMW5_HELAN|nr:hypothetical protein HanXRQr2_Chr07g0310021 [Helianthus annuus]